MCIRDSGITVQGATGVVFRDLVVDRTGLYGVYPVECKGVLVERVVVTGAKDAAIYVGQSADIVVRQSVLVDMDRITLRGLLRDGERAVLDGEGTLTDAVIASGHGFTIEGFALRDYTSNGITVHGATGVVFRDLVVDRTGLYGVYPVECKDVLVERVVVTGAKDAAIYVGQSADIVVRKSELSLIHI